MQRWECLAPDRRPSRLRRTQGKYRRSERSNEGVCAGRGRELCRFAAVIEDEQAERTIESRSDHREPANGILHAATATGSTPPNEQTAHAPPPDRARITALCVLGGFVTLGLLLIVRGSKPAAHVSSVALESATIVSVPSLSPSGAPAEPTRPKFTPTWRIALEGDATTEVLHCKLGKRALAAALLAMGVSKSEIRRVALAISGIRRVERGRPTDTLVVARERGTGTIAAFEYIVSPTEVWQAKSDEAGLTLKQLDLFVETKRSHAAIVIEADLAKAIAAAGLREQAIEEIDNALEGFNESATIKPGVRLRVVSSEQWVEGSPAGFHVEAVEYVPRSGAPLRVYYYARDHEHHSRNSPAPGYYNSKGQQPFRGMFRSPVPLARITSRFNPRRMHPVLHTVMPHNGIDFGAVSGTSVFAASAGTVRTSGDGGPCGNMVQIDHPNGLTTAYCHLSRFAAGLHPGQHVEARQLIGYVGRTGRVTGPHLHFAAKRGGTFIDPMALKMDGVRTLPPSDRDAFAKRRADLDAALDAIELPTTGTVEPADDREERDELGDD